MNNKKKKVVVMGGGNGSAIAILALKQNLEKFDIVSVVGMSDSGYSSGAIRRAFNALPPGDILRAVLALSRYDFSLLRTIFYKNRFKSLTSINKKLKAAREPNLGNLFLTLVAQYEGDFVRAVRALEEAVEAVGVAYPNTLNKVDLCAELSNGKIIKGEGEIDEPKYNRDWKIKKVWLAPTAKMYSPVKKEILTADYIVFTSGSLYTSVIAAVLPAGFKEAIKQSRANLIYLSGNAYHTAGETGPENFSAIIKTLESYLPRPLDLIIYNNHVLNSSQQKKYYERGWATFKCDSQNLLDHKIVKADYENNEGGLCSIRLGKILNKYLV